MRFFNAANNLVINLYKMYIMKFITQNPPHSLLYFDSKEGYRTRNNEERILGLQCSNNIN